MEQQIAYCTTADGVRIAYATYGNDDAPPLVLAPDLIGQRSLWERDVGRRFLTELGNARRLVAIDSRGAGDSQRDVPLDSVDLFVSDLLAVVDALNLRAFDLLATGGLCGPIALAFAARHGDRVSHLVVWGAFARKGKPNLEMIDTIRASWNLATRALGTFMFPSGPPELQRWLTRATKQSNTPTNLIAIWMLTYDLLDELAEITCPTLLLSRSLTQNTALAEARVVAESIPDARIAAFDGDCGFIAWHFEQFIGTIWDFLGVKSKSNPMHASGTAIILFTDIASSTLLTEEHGDVSFRDRSRTLDASLRAAVRDAGGTAIEGKVLGDGVMATFTSAREAIECALQCEELAATADLGLHIGIHAGDVIRESGNVYGGAVNIASRVCGLCAPGDILVSATVRDLARTSAGVAFEDRGEHALKGIEDAVRVFAVRPTSNL